VFGESLHEVAPAFVATGGDVLLPQRVVQLFAMPHKRRGWLNEFGPRSNDVSEANQIRDELGICEALLCLARVDRAVALEIWPKCFEQPY